MNWRYILRERHEHILRDKHDHPAKIHARFMIEIWRSLLRSGNSPQCRVPKTARIDGRICHYFHNMFYGAELEPSFLTMNRGSIPDPECINKWVEDMGGRLMAGLHVFRHLQRDEEHLIRAEGDIRSALSDPHRITVRRSEKKNLPKVVFDNMLDWPERLREICLMYFMCKDGLRWNADSDVFEIGKEYAKPPAD